MPFTVDWQHGRAGVPLGMATWFSLVPTGSRKFVYKCRHILH